MDIVIQEQIFGAGTATALPITLASEQLTLAELIVAKAKAKVQFVNATLSAPPQVAAQLTKKEQILNHHTLEARQQKMEAQYQDALLDAEKVGYEALDAFQKNAFFVIVDGRQRECLDETLLLMPHTQVQFIQLMPLVGG